MARRHLEKNVKTGERVYRDYTPEEEAEADAREAAAAAKGNARDPLAELDDLKAEIAKLKAK